MLHIPYDEERLPAAERAHVDAIESYVSGRGHDYCQQLFTDVTRAMPYGKTFEETAACDDWGWLNDFILLDVEGLKRLAAHPEKLRFDQFRKIYEQRFSNGSDNFVDRESSYNSFAFVSNLDVRICPYCDREYLETFERGGSQRKTLEIDHFFPKSAYPALAMCFYNLVPSGHNCNRLKLDSEIDKNPYETDIESHTRLGVDLPIGVNMESVAVDECAIKFHPHKDMRRNVEILALEERYKDQKEEAHHLLKMKQQYPDDKLEEMVRLGFFDSMGEARRAIFEEVPDSQYHPFRKMRHDLLGGK